MEENKPEKLESQFIFNHNLSTVWIDTFNIGIRSDNLALIRLMAGVPEGIVEQWKFICTHESLKKLIDVLCPMLNYFPVKAEAEAKAGVKTKAKHESTANARAIRKTRQKKTPEKT